MDYVEDVPENSVNHMGTENDNQYDNDGAEIGEVNAYDKVNVSSAIHGDNSDGMERDDGTNNKMLSGYDEMIYSDISDDFRERDLSEFSENDNSDGTKPTDSNDNDTDEADNRSDAGDSVIVVSRR